MDRGSSLLEYIEALDSWGHALYHNGHPGSCIVGADIDIELFAAQGFDPLGRRAIELAVWLRTHARADVADALDRAIKDVRGYVWAYDMDNLSPFEIDDGIYYREIDYIVEAIQHAVAQLRPLKESLPDEMWSGFGHA